MKDVFPMFDQILLAEDKAARVTAGGIELLGGTGDTPTYSVLQVGSDVKKVSVGNKVYVKFDANSFIIKRDGLQRVLVPEDRILAVVSL